MITKIETGLKVCIFFLKIYDIMRNSRKKVLEIRSINIYGKNY